MELKLGIMTNAELAEWFGVKPKTFVNSKAKKLEELKEYAEFKESRGKVEIITIFYPVYIQKKSRNYELVRAGFEKNLNPQGLDTIKRVTEQIIEDCQEELQLEVNTTYRYGLEYAKEAYGVTNSGVCGTKGYRNYEFGKWVEGEEYPIAFTEEENIIKQRLLKKYFGDTEEKQLLVKNLISAGELTREAAWGYYERISNMDHNYQAFLGELEHEIGHKVVRATRFTKMTQLGK